VAHRRGERAFVGFLTEIYDQGLPTHTIAVPVLKFIQEVASDKSSDKRVTSRPYRDIFPRKTRPR
jgi:hypothetical protein